MNTIKINGRSVCYSDTTVFQVQVGKNKSAYKDRYSFTGDIRKAAFYYECINIGNGFKKRLLMNGKPLVRAFS
jgi:hypothetical protein